MDEAKSYKTAGAFRTALENRLQTRARDEGTDLQRLRRQVAFDRFLARMFSKGPKAAYPWVLKGGYAMELRVRFARTTKDLDLTLHDGTHLSNHAVLPGLIQRFRIVTATVDPLADLRPMVAAKWIRPESVELVIHHARGWLKEKIDQVLRQTREHGRMTRRLPPSF